MESYRARAMETGLLAVNPVLANVWASWEGTTGRFDAANEVAQLGLDTARRNDDGPATVYNLCGTCTWRSFSEDATELLPLAQEAVERAEAIGSPTVLGVALFGLGSTQIRVTPAEAAAAFSRACTILDGGGSTYLHSVCAQGAATSYALSGHADEALQFIEDHLDRFTEDGSEPWTLDFVGLGLAATMDVSGARAEAAVVVGYSIGTGSTTTDFIEAWVPGLLTRLQEELGDAHYEDRLAYGRSLRRDQLVALAREFLAAHRNGEVVSP